MSQETDKKLHERLEENGYSQTKEDPNKYIGQNERGSYDKVETNSDWYRVNGGPWYKK